MIVMMMMTNLLDVSLTSSSGNLSSSSHFSVDLFLLNNTESCSVYTVGIFRILNSDPGSDSVLGNFKLLKYGERKNFDNIVFSFKNCPPD